MDMSNKRLLSLFSIIDDLEYVSTCLSAEKALLAVTDWDSQIQAKQLVDSR